MSAGPHPARRASEEEEPAPGASLEAPRRSRGAPPRFYRQSSVTCRLLHEHLFLVSFFCAFPPEKMNLSYDTTIRRSTSSPGGCLDTSTAQNPIDVARPSWVWPVL